MRPDRGARRARGRLLTARLLGDGFTVRVRVDGSSMWPSLERGSEVEIVPLRGAPRSGDIVFTSLARHGERLHRVVRTRPDGRVQTRGDACLRLDPAVPRAAVLGTLRRVRGRGGRWRRCAPRPLAWLLAAVLLGVSALSLALGRAAGGGALRRRRRCERGRGLRDGRPRPFRGRA